MEEKRKQNQSYGFVNNSINSLNNSNENDDRIIYKISTINYFNGTTKDTKVDYLYACLLSMQTKFERGMKEIEVTFKLNVGDVYYNCCNYDEIIMDTIEEDLIKNIREKTKFYYTPEELGATIK